MTAPRDQTPVCAAPACALNLAGRAHAPADCDAPPAAPTLAAETVARLPADRLPWVQGSARAFARLNPDLCPPREPGEELPGELACHPPTRARLRQAEAAAVLGDRAEVGVGAENRFRDPDQRAAVLAERVSMAALHALDRATLLADLDRLAPDTPDLSGRSVLDRRFYAFLLSDHPAARVERCRRRAAFIDETARRREVLHGWLARLDATPPRPGERVDDTARSLAATTRALLDRETARLVEEVGEPDLVRVSAARDAYKAERRAAGHRHPGYPTRYLGAAASRQPIPPEPAARTPRASRPRRRCQADRGGAGDER
ncbi:MAG TPA: hypothetical protein VG276_06545 [Actinomycetes bacterium]|jgi:hypothetical protein|nr:hypothetical protein [Actinomycetes bacterium]